MSREILFRGKDESGILNHSWQFGALDNTDEKFPKIIRLDSWGNKMIVGVAPETVGQFTGLTDKNGKKIFEGDIVDCWSEGINAQGTVQQRKDGMWIIYPAWQNKIMWGLCPDEYSKTTVEIIGNVHDNPELLKGCAE